MEMTNLKTYLWKKEFWDDIKYKYSSSIITLDQLNMELQINELKRNNVKMLHLDILDGHFSPELPLGLKMVEQISNKFSHEMFLDAHVMVNNPEFIIKQLLNIGGIDHINFHYESADHVDALLNLIKGHDKLAGVALKPATPISVLEYVIEKCDSIMIMLFNPGYSWSLNEKQIEYTYRKVDDLYNLIQKRNLKTKIMVDGRVSIDNINHWKDQVGIYVLGSTCINHNDITKSIIRLNDKTSKEV